MLAKTMVKIEWLDSLTQSPWTDLEEARGLEPVTVFSIGYLICRANNAVTIVGMIGLEDCVSMIQVIPDGCIIEIEDLGEV